MINHRIDGLIRWCTPSIDPRVPRARDVYDTDISISYHKLGNPCLDTGYFGEATKLASLAYGSDRTLFSVNGSSGSNFVVMRALKHQLREVHVLAQRNIHKSLAVAFDDYQINVNYLSPNYDANLNIFIPNHIDEYVQALRKNPETNVVLITNPTYEGYSLDLKKLIKTLRRLNPELIIFVDEAWGAHFNFSDELPITAMESGADISIQSTHKLGSGLQQTGMIHLKTQRIDEDNFIRSYQALSTTSPSFHLMASLDGARYFMETYGEESIESAVEVAERLSIGLSEIDGLSVVEQSKVKNLYPQIASADQTKVLVRLEDTSADGSTLAESLETKHKIILEKHEAKNLLFVSTFQNTLIDADKTSYLVSKAFGGIRSKRSSVYENTGIPSMPQKIVKKLPSYKVYKEKSESIELEKSVGKVAAEDIVPFPPGIPLVIKGEQILEDHVSYLEALRETKGLMSVVMSDREIKKIKVINGV